MAWDAMPEREDLFEEGVLARPNRTMSVQVSPPHSCSSLNLIGQLASGDRSGSSVGRVRPSDGDQAAIIFSFASGTRTASSRVSAGHWRPSASPERSGHRA